VPGYALHHYSYAELLHNKKIREKKGKKGIALRVILAAWAGNKLPNI